MHVESLEDRLNNLIGEHEELQQRYTCLSIEYEKIVRARDGVMDRDGGLKRECMDDEDGREGEDDCEGEKDEVEIEDEGEGGIESDGDGKGKTIRVDWRSGEQRLVQPGKEGIQLHDFLLSDGWVA